MIWFEEGGLNGVCMNTSSYWRSAREERNSLLCAADGKPARFLVLGDSHSRIFHYINHVTNSRAFDACCVTSATALGLTNIDSSTQALKRFRTKLQPLLQASEPPGLSYSAVLVMMGIAAARARLRLMYVAAMRATTVMHVAMGWLSFTTWPCRCRRG